MKSLTIFTRSYYKEVLKFISPGSDGITSDKFFTGKAGDTYYLSIQIDSNTENILAGKLASAAQQSVLMSNAILKSSSKLAEILEKMVFSDNCKLENELSEFISRNDELNFDGYIYFALNEYTDRINSILYGIIRRSLYV